MNSYRTPSRDYWGRWTKGSSGNPRGRPKGAKDKKRRFRFEADKRSWNCAANLGDYAVKGGPGRKKGGSNRPKQHPSEKEQYVYELRSKVLELSMKIFNRLLNADI